MTQERISLFVDHIGPFDAQKIGVLRGKANSGLELLNGHNIEVVQGFACEFDRLERFGFSPGAKIGSDFGDLDMALVQITRSKVETKLLVAQAWDATRVGGRIVVDGQKTDGIESIYKALRKLGIEPDTLVKSHGRIFWFERDETRPFADWLEPKLKMPDGFATAPGVFSAEKLDKGSLALIAALPPLAGHGADIGAGWGFLSRAALGHEKVTKLDLIEAEIAALDAARVNIIDERANFEWADVTKTSGRFYDFIIANPPFHTERTANTDLGVAFLTTAARNLKPKGQFYCVANRHLPYEAVLNELFRNVAEIGGTSAFKVFQAAQPRRL